MSPVRAVCVFCGSRAGADPAYARAAGRLGTLLAEQEVRLIFGAGGIGLMGVMADAALAAGGEVVGVIPTFLRRPEVAHEGVSEQIEVATMHERKHRMFDLADGFVVLPGGLGTLDETFEIITWKQLRLHAKPIVIVDVSGYWGGLQRLVDDVVESGFADPTISELFSVVRSAEDVLPTLARAAVVREARPDRF